LRKKVQNFNIKYLVKQKTFCNFELQHQKKSNYKNYILIEKKVEKTFKNIW
jgi:hypothetical protein